MPENEPQKVTRLDILQGQALFRGVKQLLIRQEKKPKKSLRKKEKKKNRKNKEKNNC